MFTQLIQFICNKSIYIRLEKDMQLQYNISTKDTVCKPFQTYEHIGLAKNRLHALIVILREHHQKLKFIKHKQIKQIHLKVL